MAPHTCKYTLFSWAAVGLCYMRKLDFFITIRKVCSREKVKAKVNSHCIGYFLKRFLDFGCFPVLFWKYYLPCLPSVPLLPVYLLLVLLVLVRQLHLFSYSLCLCLCSLPLFLMLFLLNFLPACCMFLIKCRRHAFVSSVIITQTSQSGWFVVDTVFTSFIVSVVTCSHFLVGMRLKVKPNLMEMNKA